MIDQFKKNVSSFFPSWTQNPGFFRQSRFLLLNTKKRCSFRFIFQKLKNIQKSPFKKKKNRQVSILRKDNPKPVFFDEKRRMERFSHSFNKNFFFFRFFLNSMNRLSQSFNFLLRDVWSLGKSINHNGKNFPMRFAIS